MTLVANIDALATAAGAAIKADRDRLTILEATGAGFLELVTTNVDVIVLNDTLVDGAANVTQAVNTAPITVSGTPTVVLF